MSGSFTKSVVAILCMIVLSVSMVTPTLAQDKVLRVAVTTSFENSGLADVILPVAEQDLDADIQLIVVGTGQALKLGAAGDVDGVLVHSKTAEEAFVKDGHGLRRTEIMFNDFVLIGPNTDPAKIARTKNTAAALQTIAATKSLFVSRGDDSGTHKKERSLWASAGFTAFDATWYRETGSGMGAALNTAAGLNAYVLSDRGTWLKFGNKADLALLFSGDPVLQNQYAYLPVDPAKHSHIAADLSVAFEAWLVSPKGQALINGYRLEGEQLFQANAEKN